MSDAGRGSNAKRRVRQRGNPGTPQDAPRLGTNRPDIRLRVVDVGNLEGSITMTRRTLFQLPVEGLMGVGSSAALPFFNLLSACSMVDSDGESLIARSGYLPAVAGQLERRPRRLHGLLLQGFIVLINELHHQCLFSSREFTPKLRRFGLGSRPTTRNRYHPCNLKSRYPAP